MKTYLALFILVFAALSGMAQTLKKGDVRGTYIHSTGDPARTIQRNDSSTISISYMETSRTTLTLKRAGRLKMTDQFMDMEPVKKKGNWKMVNDTISLYIGDDVEQFTFRRPVYLESVDGDRGYQKQLQ